MRAGPPHPRDPGGGGFNRWLTTTAAGCAPFYEPLAPRLDFRAYGEMTGIALLLAIVSVSRWVGGDYWLAAGVAAGAPLFAGGGGALGAPAVAHLPPVGPASAPVGLVVRAGAQPAPRACA